MSIGPATEKGVVASMVGAAAEKGLRAPMATAVVEIRPRKNTAEKNATGIKNSLALDKC